MSRYIDAERLVAWCMETYKTQSTVSGKAYVNALLTKVDSCPTADVVEVRHGEWIKATPYSQEYCNQCGLTPKTIFGKLPPYCPNCGAKMDGERRTE